MAKGYRQGRLGEEIRKIVSNLLLRELKDPRLSGLLSVSGVNVTEDGSYATVYITSLETASEDTSEEKKEDIIAAFNSAKGMIRKEIGKKVKLRHVPELIFKMDTSLEYGRHISKIIDELAAEKTENDEDEE
ncbi:MAG: 30S ribosome-binding factor RbfA [Anaerovoracaceae bacterium]|jgi:ribosome-binding factor A